MIISPFGSFKPLKTAVSVSCLALHFIISIPFTATTVLADDDFGNWSGYFFPDPNPSSIYVNGNHTFLGGTWNVSIAANIGWGAGNVGHVTQRGGEFNVGTLRLAHKLHGTQSTKGYYTLVQGILSTNETVVGNNGRGTFEHIHGTHSVAGKLHLKNGSYQMHHGILNANQLSVQGPYEFVQHNGTTHIAERGILGLASGKTNLFGMMHLHGGTVHFGQGLHLAHSAKASRENSDRPNSNRARFYLHGGVLIGDIHNLGGVDVFGGTHVGNIYNQWDENNYRIAQGRVNVHRNFIQQGLIDNKGIIAISDSGRLQLAGSGLINHTEGRVMLNSGIIQGSGGLVNHGYFLANGQILGSGPLTNYGQIHIDRALDLQRTGQVFNHGQWSVENGRLNLLQSTRLINVGSIELSQSEVFGPGHLDNRSDGKIISTRQSRIAVGQFTNQGQIEVASGSLEIAGHISQQGEIILSNHSSLTGAAIENFGTIRGQGDIHNAISNRGLIRAEEGTLTVHQPLNARRDSQLSAGQGGTLQIMGMGFSNEEKIILDGGTVGFQAGLANHGNVSGQGTLLSSLLRNFSTIQFDAGNSSIVGPAENHAGGRIELRTSALVDFKSRLTLHGGSQIDLSADSTARYLGDVSIDSGVQLTGTGNHHFEKSLQSLNGPQTISFGGNVHFGDSNLYRALLGGDSLDQLWVAGELQFGGTLAIETLPDFSGQLGDTFQLFQWGSSLGEFAAIDLSGALLEQDLRWDLGSLYSSGTIAIAAIPEPSSAMLLTLAILGACCYRGRRSQIASPLTSVML